MDAKLLLYTYGYKSTSTINECISLYANQWVTITDKADC